jgi:circadian clock protein KaiC
MRGQAFRAGRCDAAIVRGGLRVFPGLALDSSAGGIVDGTISTGIVRLDSILGGGLDRGTATLLVGPAGVGKSSVTMHAAHAVAEQGPAAAVYLFDERPPTWLKRADSFGMAPQEQMRRNRLYVHRGDPAELSPGEFTDLVRRRVEVDGVRLVVIDSLNGFLNAMPGERFLALHMHRLLTYLGQRGVTTLMVLAQQGLYRDLAAPSVDVSYLADTVIQFQYGRKDGEMRPNVSVVKRRGGRHERGFYALLTGPAGVDLGERLEDIG